MSNFILFCNPVGSPVYNEHMAIKYLWLQKRLRKAETGASGLDGSFTPGARFLGIHSCTGKDCKEVSTNYDIRLMNGLITNSLAYHYLVFHTEEVPLEDIHLLEQLRDEVEDMFSKCTKCKQYRLKNYKGHRLLKTCKECKKV